MIKCRAIRCVVAGNGMREVIALSATLALAGCVQTTHLNPSSSDVLWSAPPMPIMQPAYPAYTPDDVYVPSAAPMYGNTPLYGEIPSAYPAARKLSPRAHSRGTHSSNKTSRSCGRRKLCGQVSSCEEAYYLLRSCGFRNLDRDRDGVPCESLCPGG